MDCSLPGSSIHGIFQARVLEWGAIAFSRNGIIVEPLYDPAILFMGIYLKGLKASSQKDIFIPMFIAALCTIAKMWKQPKYPSTDEQINKMWQVHTMEYYTALKRNEILSQATTWINLEDIIICEIS